MSSGRGRGTDCTRCPFMNKLAEGSLFYRIQNSSTGRGSRGCNYGYGKEASSSYGFSARVRVPRSSKLSFRKLPGRIRKVQQRWGEVPGKVREPVPRVSNHSAFIFRLTFARFFSTIFFLFTMAQSDLSQPIQKASRMVQTMSFGLKACQASLKDASYGDISPETSTNPSKRLMKKIFLDVWMIGTARTTKFSPGSRKTSTPSIHQQFGLTKLSKFWTSWQNVKRLPI
jgi:hypothetical protein